MPYKDPEAAARNRRERYQRNKKRDRGKRLSIERKYRAKQKLLHPEKVKAQYRQRYWSNHEKTLADAARRRSTPEAKEKQKQRSREWYQANKEHARKMAKAYIAKDRDRWLAYSKAHYRENSARYQETRKNWESTHPEQSRAIHHASHVNRRARKASVFVEAVYPSVVFTRDKGICGICRKRVDVNSKWELDHIIPISKRGAHSYDNVQLAHRKCNRSKGAKLLKVQATLFQVVAS